MDHGNLRPKQGAQVLTVLNQLIKAQVGEEGRGVATLPNSQLFQPPLYLQKAAIYFFVFSFGGVSHVYFR